jgi:hypothetical protein
VATSGVEKVPGNGPRVVLVGTKISPGNRVVKGDDTDARAQNAFGPGQHPVPARPAKQGGRSVAAAWSARFPDDGLTPSRMGR